MPVREIVGKTVGFGLVSLALIFGGILDLVGGHVYNDYLNAASISRTAFDGTRRPRLFCATNSSASASHNNAAAVSATPVLGSPGVTAYLIVFGDFACFP